jgi:FixJ family two-component response regulator
MSDEPNTVFIIDDDEFVTTGISLLLQSAGCHSRCYHRLEKFIASENFNGTGCILLDIFLEGESGLDFQEEISTKFWNLPIIYITGMGDVPMSVKAMKKGAINFLQKPVDEEVLLNAVREALTRSAELVKEQNQTMQIQSRLKKLTHREYEIFQLILTGMLNKQIASELNIAEHTVKLHRGMITKKLGVKSVAEMVHMAEKLKLP